MHRQSSYLFLMLGSSGFFLPLQAACLSKFGSRWDFPFLSLSRPTPLLALGTQTTVAQARVFFFHPPDRGWATPIILGTHHPPTRNNSLSLSLSLLLDPGCTGTNHCRHQRTRDSNSILVPPPSSDGRLLEIVVRSQKNAFFEVSSPAELPKTCEPETWHTWYNQWQKLYRMHVVPSST